MLKAILVDDEPLIIRGLKKIVNWQKCGFEIAGVANNGESALHLVEDLAPDLVVTDIKMPGMDGLELIRKVKDISSNVYFIILSGYSEFLLAQKAIKYGCYDYILKPINTVEFEQVLMKLKLSIERDLDRQTEDLQTKEKLEKTIPVIRSKLMQDILAGTYRQYNDLAEQLDILGITIHNDFYIIVAELDNQANTSNQMEFSSIIDFPNLREINRFVSDKMCGFTVALRADKLMLILTSHYQPISKNFASNICTGIKNLIEMTNTQSLTFGVSSRCKDLLQLIQGNKEAEIALKYRLLGGNNKIFFFDEIQQGENITFSYPFNIEKELLAAVQNRDYSKADLAICKLASYIKHYEIISPDYIFKVCNELLMMTLRLVFDLGTDISKVFDVNRFTTDVIKQNRTIDQLFSWLKCCYKEIIDEMVRSQSQNKKAIIGNIKRYIDEHYQEEINLDELANHFQYNSSYLSQLFKNETGSNIFNYLTEIRIYNAKVLLNNKDAKIYEVCRKVGYQDAKYFSQVFRKVTGMTPVEYRGKIKS